MATAAPDPSHIMQVGMGFWASKTLLSAVELELFTRLGSDGMTGAELAEQLGLDEDELNAALDIDADVIGINNRDLEDFSVDLGRTFELLADVPAGKTVVSESGIERREQVEELEQVGVDAVLVGEALMRAPDPEAAVRELARTEEPTQA